VENGFDDNRAYDNNTATYAYIGSHALNDWSGFIELQTDSTISSNKLRIYCASLYDGVLPFADIDVYDMDTTSWVNVFQGYVSEEMWVTKTFSTRNVNAMRIRFYEGGIVYPHRLYEVDFWGTY